MKGMAKIGVALFEKGSPFSASGNVACEYRGTPFDFSSASDLPSQTLWITNCTWDELKSAGLHKTPKLAHDGYYRTRVSQIVTELGLTLKPLNQQAAMLAELLGNGAEMAKYQLGLTHHPSNSMSQGIAQLHGAHEPHEDSPVRVVAEQAAQGFTVCERERRHKNAEVFTFWFPRHSHAQHMLSQPLPNNQSLSRVPLHQLPTMGKDPVALVAWAVANRLPLFARLKVLALEDTMGKLLNWGAGARNVVAGSGTSTYEARNMRDWCSLPELEILAHAGELAISDVAVASGWYKPAVVPFDHRVAPVSYAYGLVAENLWTGLTRKPTATATIAKTLSTAWLQALDRMKCLQAAEALHRLGMEVMSYGNGRITVECPVSVRALIPQAAVESDLMFPASLVGLAPAPARPGCASDVMQLLLSQLDYGRITAMDQAALAELRTSRGY